MSVLADISTQCFSTREGTRPRDERHGTALGERKKGESLDDMNSGSDSAGDAAPALGSEAQVATQIHVLVGCSDARDVGQIHLEVVEKIRDEYLARGIRSELYVLRTPGTFVTADVVTDIRRIVESTQRELRPGEAAEYFVHVLSHGELSIEGSEKYRCGLHDLTVEQGSVFNCGMLGATRVAVDLERLLLGLRPEVRLPDGGSLVLDSEEAIRTLLWKHYGYDGYMAGDWIRSVDDLRTHTRLQKSVVERAVRTDPNLRRFTVRVTAGIQDYRHNAYVRVDGGEPDGKFWDEGQRSINRTLANLPAHSIDRARQSEGQMPLVGLLAMSDIRGSRARALAHYAAMSHRPVTSYEPNTVFAISGSALDLPGTPFGPYAVAGLFYSVQSLGLRQYLLMGSSQAQVERMMSKVEKDPLVGLVVKHFRVALVPAVIDVTENGLSRGANASTDAEPT